VEYGIFQELGTSKMPAQPFLIPALEAWRNRFLDAFRELFR
jgi:HK97 gp10 family phage protein